MLPGPATPPSISWGNLLAEFCQILNLGTYRGVLVVLPSTSKYCVVLVVAAAAAAAVVVVVVVVVVPVFACVCASGTEPVALFRPRLENIFC